jgi:FtsP/CotA-like multicopper oxidase with cupredoxin domain
MDKHKLAIILRCLLVIACLGWGVHTALGKKQADKMRGTTQGKRKAARRNLPAQTKGVRKTFAGVSAANAKLSTLTTAAPALAAMATPLMTPDYFAIPNWANSPLPAIDPLSGAISGGMRKFVDGLPGLCGVSAPNNLGQCLPVATPDTTTFPGSDYYRIGLNDFNLKLHTDLPPTKLRGYVDLSTNQYQYLGPLILATRNRPVRVLFQNSVATDLFIPTDTTYMGMMVNNTPASQKRATLHLHGGNTPWISDGTTHQWVTPAQDQPATLGLAKGFSFQNVPDMVGPGNTSGNVPKPIPAPNLTDGLATFYWPNQQSGRLLFYHDHAYGMTRLNVYSGEAAGYLVVDPAQETALKNASVPGTIITDPATGAITNADLAHFIPLVIQDKTFVPDNGDAGGQLAATDPTWDVAKFGGAGNLWFPHVYMPNQNPYDNTGASAFGRWDYGPWFWPVFPTSIPPVPCTSAAYPGVSLTCPATPNPSGTPESFMDTPLVNGTAYPKLDLDPAAYRFQILSAGNDRTLNLQLYVAEPISISVAKGGTGYTTPTVTITDLNAGSGFGAQATATVSTGSVEFVTIADPGAGYSTAPTVVFTGGGGNGAQATAIVGGGTVTGIVVSNGGSGYTSAPAVTLSGGGATTPASALAIITPSGVITDITVTNPGSGYTKPIVTITDPNPAAAGALAMVSVNTEVKMLPAVPRVGGISPLLCGTITEMAGGGLAKATLDGSGKPINGTGLPAGCWPNYGGGVTWPTDGRDGGVPDPSTAGPPIVEIGTEAGLLPAPAVIPSTPVNYVYNRRDITVLNVLNHGLYLGPADRADIIIDFSQFAGKTLILYNDAPAPVPATDPRIDYYTNNPDQSDTGGAPTTMAGFGPNTRTIMQINVRPTGAPNAMPFSISQLAAALPGIFATTQDTIIVPEPAFPAQNGNGPATYVRIQDTSLKAFIGGPLGGVSLTSGGAGYTAAPTVTIDPPTTPCKPGLVCVPATAIAKLAPTSVGSLTRTAGGAGFTSAPTVTISGGGGSGTTATAVLAPRSVASIGVTNGGKSYTSAPTVTISAPQTVGGTRATATTTVSKGNVTAVTLTNGGTGYTALPTITFSGGGSGAAATATLAPAAVASLTLTNGGSGYTSAPTVTITNGGGSGATAIAALTPTVVSSVVLTNPGNGYTFAPAVTISAPQTAGSMAVATASAPTKPIQPKTIQELFTADYGRMNATLGVEVPFSNALIQTTIPYGYVDPPTEIFKDGETQIWKITHNGVDTHFIHFHLFTVQVLNRVGWDGAIKPPDPNELAWKDTVRMNPLEDVIVALRAMRQTDDLGITTGAPAPAPLLGKPFELPNSVRPMDVTTPVGSNAANEFTNVDPTNQPAAVTNDIVNFGWEYVWHCHILGHEENDMMRAMSMAVSPIAPTAGTLTAGGTSNRPTVRVTWTDNSLNETGFTIQRATVVNGTTGAFTNVATVGPGLIPNGVLSYTDTTVARRTTYAYRVIANNMVGYTKTYAAPAAGYPHVAADSAPAAFNNIALP